MWGEGEITHRHGKVTCEEPVLEDTPIRNIDALTLVRHDDDRPT